MIWNRDIFGELERFRSEMDSLVSSTKTSSENRNYPLVNVYDEKEEIVLNAELPGMSKNDIEITYSEDFLTISGERKESDASKEMSAIRKEINSGKFEKKIGIPVKIDVAKISATFTDGILTVTLPKAEEAKPKTISIETK